MGYLRKECESCLSWSGRESMCLRVAYGMACIEGPFAVRPGEVTWFTGPLSRGPLPGKAKDTQVAGDHYKQMGVEPWDVVDTWPLEQRIGAYRHGALKYLMRMGRKDQNAQEIAKGKHYLEKLLEVLIAT